MTMSKMVMALAFSVACAGAARASLITINVTDGGPGVATNAGNIGGVVASPYIENMSGGGGGGAMVNRGSTSIANFRDSTGASSGVSVMFSSGWNGGDYQSAAPIGFETGADNSSNEMMQNYTDTSNGSVIFTGLGGWLSGQGATAYNVYVMSDRSVNLYEGSFSIGAQKFWLSNGGNGANGIAGPYKLGTATTLAAAQAVSNGPNYLEFTGLTSDSFTLAVARDTGGSGWVTMNSLQIEAIPEPGTVSLAGLVGAALLLRRRRKLAQ